MRAEVYLVLVHAVAAIGRAMFWFFIIFLAAYLANMAAFYQQGRILLERLP